MNTRILAMTAILLSLNMSMGQAAEHQVATPFSQAMKHFREGAYYDAISIFLALAEQGDHDAQYNAAFILHDGIGVPQDYVKALELALLAKLGNVKRADELSEDLLDIVPEDRLEGIYANVLKQLENKVAAGDISYITQMAHYYSDILNPADEDQALTWWMLATALNIKDAKKTRDELASSFEVPRLLEVQANAKAIFEEQKFAEKFLKPHPKD